MNTAEVLAVAIILEQSAPSPVPDLDGWQVSAGRIGLVHPHCAEQVGRQPLVTFTYVAQRLRCHVCGEFIATEWRN